MWTNLLPLLKAYFSSCVLCGLSSGRTLFACDDCWQQLQARQLQPPLMQQWIGDLVTLSWMEWDQSTDHLTTSIAYALKNGHCQPDWDFLAEHFIKRLHLHFDPWLLRDPLLIPSPPRQSGCIDHAAQFARALAKVTRGEVRPLLKRGAGPDRQKYKDRNQRAQIQLELLEPDISPFFRPGQTIVFVDDVLTTGSTARAAYKALGSPSQFVIWTLFRRRLLLSPGPFDILRQ